MTLAIEERRGQRRYRVTLPLEIARPDTRERVGLSRDASVAGVLFNTRSRFAPGDRVDVTLHLSTEQTKRVRAEVVRVEVVPRDSNFLWRYLAAVRFTEPLPELEAALHEHTTDPRPSHPSPSELA